MYDRQERLDHLVWDKNDDDWEQSLDLMRLQSTCRRVENLAGQHFGTPATLVLPLVLGGFNMLYRIRLEGASTDVMVRRPGTSLVPFPEEKTKQEAATANYIAENTEIPVPRHLFCGHDPLLGAFVIMQRVEHRQSMSDRLTTPNDGRSVTHRLDPNVPDATLEDLWTQTARCLVQLAHLTFPRIGALVEENGSYDVAGRPITHNMTDMIRLANVPRAVLPREGTTYQTADEWYTALAEMHLAQLLFQHNDVVSSADDCRNKWVARQIFRRLAKQGRLSVFGFAEDDWSAQSSSRAMASARLSPAPAGSGAFRLWGDDLRTGNILLSDSGKIAAMVDWEFAYAAPTQFILDPPWWLLLDRAETWPTGMDNWTTTYEARLKIWLSAMERAEDSLGEPVSRPLPVALSTYMRESWETGRFWLSYGARKSWAFDAMYWKCLDERFFGERGHGVAKQHLWKTRIHLLTDDERAAMEPFVEAKMKAREERVIVDWDPDKAKQRLSEVLFD